MNSIKMYVIAAVALVTVASGATSAAAANWDPANTNLAGSGTLSLATNSVGSVTCTITITIRSTGNDLATSTAPPTFDNCGSNIANPTVVTSTTNWTLTATSTTAVDLASSFGVNIGGGLCSMTLGAVIANNNWSNTLHALSFNFAQSFPITEHGFCDGGTSATMAGTVQFPSSAIIT
jgi:hypothetical protein